LDWIAQVVYKRSGDDRALAGPIQALNDTLNVQSTLCPNGEARVLTHDKIAERIAEVATSAPQSYLT
jgi:hypothetical protein